MASPPHLGETGRTGQRDVRAEEDETAALDALHDLSNVGSMDLDEIDGLGLSGTGSESLEKRGIGAG